jgi:hypothetical protein
MTRHAVVKIRAGTDTDAVDAVFMARTTAPPGTVAWANTDFLIYSPNACAFVGLSFLGTTSRPSA